MSLFLCKFNIKGEYYESTNKEPYLRVLPRNFKVVYLVHEDSYFINHTISNADSYIDAIDLYIGTRVVYLMAAIALMVAFFAMLLPCIKFLHTGWEQIFSLHIETLICLGVAFVFGVYFMCNAMAYTNTYEIQRYISQNGIPEILDYSLDRDTIYQVLLLISYLACFMLVFSSCQHGNTSSTKLPELEELYADSIETPPILLAVTSLFTIGEDTLVVYQQRDDTLFTFWKLPECSFLFKNLLLL